MNRAELWDAYKAAIQEVDVRRVGVELAAAHFVKQTRAGEGRFENLAAAVDRLVEAEAAAKAALDAHGAAMRAERVS